MKPEFLLALVFVLGTPVLVHFYVREFWAASFLSALASAIALSLLVVGPNGPLSSWLSFVIGGALLLLIPGFLVGMLFQRSRHRLELQAQISPPSQGKHRRLILGIGALAIGSVTGASVVASALSSPLSSSFPIKAMLGAIAFAAVGAWQLIALYKERTSRHRDAA